MGKECDMKKEYEIRYLNCQSCSAKIHCDDCAANLKERLALRGLKEIEIDIPQRRLTLNGAGMDEFDLLDLLEELSIFAD